QDRESEIESRGYSCKRWMATLQPPFRFEAFQDSGKTGMVCISGSRKTISCQDCSSLCVTAQDAFKPVRRDCLLPRRMGCDTSGSPLPICRTEPAHAVHSISGFVSPTFRAMPRL